MEENARDRAGARDATGPGEAASRAAVLHARYQAIWDHAPVGIVVYDANLSVVDCNDTFARIVGSPRDDLLGLTMDELRDQRHREPLRRALAGDVVTVDAPYEATTSGHWLWLRATYVPMRDASGGISHAMVLVPDRNPEGTLRAVGQLTRELTEVKRIAGVATWTWDAARDVYALSPELHELLGTDRSTFVTTLDGLAQMIPADERAAVAEELSNVLRDRRTYAQQEIHFLRADGTPRWAILRGDFHFDRTGRPLSAWGTVQDVTEERTLAARYRQGHPDPMGRLTASVTHEFSNLLTVILTNLGMAAARLPTDAEVRVELADALAAGKQAAALIRRLLEPGRQQQMGSGDR